MKPLKRKMLCGAVGAALVVAMSASFSTGAVADTKPTIKIGYVEGGTTAWPPRTWPNA